MLWTIAQIMFAQAGGSLHTTIATSNDAATAIVTARRRQLRCGVTSGGC